MLLLSIPPARLLPYHHPTEGRLLPFPRAGPVFPRIPVFELPQDLRLSNGALACEYGDYVLYNGHHRRWAALLAGAETVEVAVLQCDEDLMLNNGTELLRLRPRVRAFEHHRRAIFSRVHERTLRVLADEHEMLSRAGPST